LWRPALILASAVAWTSPAALTADEVLPTTITVRVFQAARLASTLEQRAFVEAETVLRSARVDVRWNRCGAPNSSPICDVPKSPSGLLLIVREGPPIQNGSAPLGRAFIRTAGDLLATVNYNRVAELARLSRADAAVLLGRVVAHELAHLIMNTSAHSLHGLMRPNWTPEEVRRNRAADWAFTAADVAAIRQARLTAP
jgi:hypothetical protein